MHKENDFDLKFQTDRVQYNYIYNLNILFTFENFCIHNYR